ncbi:MAG TPA: primosomal protein N', partial [Candidatus Binataceae bacterium]
MHTNTIPARLIMQAQVVVLAAPKAIDLLTYAVPERLRASIAPGHRVLVPLRSRVTTGIVIELGDHFAPDETRLRAIADQIEPEPILDEAHMRLMRFTANYYMSSLSEAYRAAIPGAFRIETRTTIKLSHKPDPLAFASLNLIERSILAALGRAPLTTRSLARFGDKSQVNSAIATLDSYGLLERSESTRGRHREPRAMLVRATEGAARSAVRGTNRKAIIHALIESSPAPVPIDRLEAIIPSARSTVRQLAARGLVEVLSDRQLGVGPAKLPVLTEEQDAAVRAVVPALNEKRFEAFLLWGITASGKTEVYLRLAAECLGAGRQVLILVPEIALTEYLVASLTERFGQTVAIAHSDQNISERWESWRAAIRGFARVMIGPRSALFAPIRDLGLIVVDEEHDSAYKQEEGIRYNARDLAVALAKFSDCPVVLGSATPSAESFANSRVGRYRLLRMTKRIGDRPFASVQVIDLREESRRRRVKAPPASVSAAASPGAAHHAAPKPVPFAPRTIEALRSNLEAGQQSIVFINRRGYHSFLQCHRCGAVLTCTNCSVTMTFHLRDHSLRCHYCGERTAAPDGCPECHELGLEGQGFGTERLASELMQIFPAARIERIDSDIGRRAATRNRIIEALRRGEVDMLVGTQMITKGFDFPGVTLVAAVAADLALNLPDFRSAERTFQLLTQVAGRAGRGDSPGQVLIQTFAPNHYSIRAAREQDYLRFMRRELQLRRELYYPPYARMALLRIEGDVARKVEALASAASEVMSRASSRPAIRILGPAPAPIERIKGRYRWQVVVKAPAISDL